MSSFPTDPDQSEYARVPQLTPLTQSQRKMLDLYRTFRRHPPTTLSLALRNSPVWLVLAGLTVIVFFAAQLPQGPGPRAAWVLALLLGVFSVGAVIRDFGHARRSARTLPLVTQILDWDKIDRLLKYH